MKFFQFTNADDTFGLLAVMCINQIAVSSFLFTSAIIDYLICTSFLRDGLTFEMDTNFLNELFLCNEASETSNLLVMIFPLSFDRLFGFMEKHNLRCKKWKNNMDKNQRKCEIKCLYLCF